MHIHSDSLTANGGVFVSNYTSFKDHIVDNLAGGTSYTSSAGGYSASGSYTVTTGTSTGSHCCACSGACLHTGGPWFCQAHGGNWNAWPSPIPSTPTFPANPTITFPEVKCFICKENLPLDEIFAGEKVCEDCRTTIEAFKVILVKEKEEK